MKGITTINTINNTMVKWKKKTNKNSDDVKSEIETNTRYRFLCY